MCGWREWPGVVAASHTRHCAKNIDYIYYFALQPAAINF